MAIDHFLAPEPVTPQRVVHCTPLDAATLVAHLPEGPAERELPGSAEHAHLDRLVMKPWGHELRIYDDRWMDVWRLRIEESSGTSLHAHPRKDTALICIEGDGVLVTGAGEEIGLTEGSVVHIAAGALHATRTEHGVSLLEVEAPRDKFDLVRIDDAYGRAGKQYEDAAHTRREPCRLEELPAGPPQARLRRHCATGCFRFNLELGVEAWRSPLDLVVAVSLDPSAVLRRELAVVGANALAALDREQLYLTVRSNHR